MERRYLTGDLMRQLGLAARGGAQGVAALPAMLWNGPAGVANWAAGTNIPRADIGPALDALGLPGPVNPVESVAQNVAEAMAGVGGAAMLARGGAQALSGPVEQAISALFGEGLRASLASAAVSAGASGVARENEIGSAGQVLAGLVGGVVPGLAGTVGPLASIRARAAEQSKLAPTGVGPWGPQYGGLAGDPQNAIAHLLRMRTGEVPGAVSHADVPGGQVSLIYGQPPGPKTQGYGVAKLYSKHPETLPDLQQFMSSMIKDEGRSGSNRFRLTDGARRQGVVSFDRQGEPVAPWLLTAYEKQNPAQGGVVASSGRMGIAEYSGENHTAPLTGRSSVAMEHNPRQYVGLSSPEKAAAMSAANIQAIRDALARAMSGTALGMGISAGQ